MELSYKLLPKYIKYLCLKCMGIDPVTYDPGTYIPPVVRVTRFILTDNGNIKVEMPLTNRKNKREFTEIAEITISHRWIKIIERGQNEGERVGNS